MSLVHLTNKELEKIYHVKQTNKIGFKPRGLWYSPDEIWYKYYASFSEDIEYKYKYNISLHYTSFRSKNKDKILKINDDKTFDLFTLKYGYFTKSKATSSIFILIKWNDVSRDYGGIEIIPLITSRIRSYDVKIIKKYNNKFNFCTNNDYRIELIFWLYTFDVPSGCVWNPKVIKEIKYIFE